MNPRQRRGVLLLALAAVGAIAVFVAVSSYVSDVRSEVSPKSRVLRLTKDVAAYQPVPEDALEAVEVPDRWAPGSAIRERSGLVGTVAGTDLARGSFLQRGMLIPEPSLNRGQRELAILVDAETGVAGKVRPGSVVDIHATFPGDQRTTPRSQIVVAGARIIDVGRTETLTQPREGGGVAQEEVVPVTFALSVRESLILTYAESFAEEVRLALTRPGDRRTAPRSTRSFQLDISPAGR